MKPDYIRGLGDSGEYSIIGGSFDPSITGYLKMGLESPGFMNRFFVGVLTNKEQVKRIQGYPKFLVLFAVEAGFTKDYLASLGIRHASSRVKAVNQDRLPYVVDIASSVSKIDYFFPRPIVMTLKGSSYDSIISMKRWTLRHPRLVNERADFDWMDTISFQELQALGANSTKISNSETEMMEQLLLRLDLENLNQRAGIENIINTSHLPTIEMILLSQNFSQIRDCPDKIELTNINLYYGTKLFESVSAKIKNLRLVNPQAIIDGSGWNCKRSQHDQENCLFKVGVFFIEDTDCEQLLVALETEFRSKCKYGQPIFIVDLAWIKLQGETYIGPNYILCKIDPRH